MCGTWADNTGGGKVETKPQRRTLVVLHENRTDGKNYTFKVIHYDHRKTHKCKENGRHAAMLKIPERVYEECQVKLENATVKSHETIMLTLPIGGCL